MKNLILVSMFSLFAIMFSAGCSSAPVSTSGKLISVSAVKNTVWEGDTLTFVISLSEPNKTGSDLKIFCSVGGSAVQGDDLDSLLPSDFILIPRDSQSAVIKALSFDDSPLEETEDVILNITGCSSSEYSVAYNTKEQVVIMDNDGPTVTDIDGHVYHSVLIGTQTWMVENLNTSRYRNGDSVSQWWFHSNDPNNGIVFGRLYDWYAVSNSKGLAPVGWHVPSWDEFVQLRNAVNYDGNSLKARYQGFLLGTGTNTSGFTGLLAGSRTRFGVFTNNTPTEGDAFFWTSEGVSEDTAGSMSLSYFSANIFMGSFNRLNGMSVRCIKDN